MQTSLRRAAILLFVLVSLPFQAALAQSPANACLIVKHKGTVGRRLLWAALIAVPIAPGTKYDYVDAMNLSSTKMSYKGKDLTKLQKKGVHVVVLNNKFSAADLEEAKKSCASVQPRAAAK